MLKTLFGFLSVVVLLYSQDGTAVSLSQGPPYVPYTTLQFFDGSARLEYLCIARPTMGSPSKLTISGITAANPGVFTYANHGIELGQAPKASISGGASTWAIVNGLWIIDPIDANTFYIRDPTTGTRLNTSSGSGGIGTIILTIDSARTTAYVWSIRKFVYVSATQTNSFWARGSGGMSGNRCSDRAATTTEWR